MTENPKQPGKVLRKIGDERHGSMNADDFCDHHAGLSMEAIELILAAYLIASVALAWTAVPQRKQRKPA
jgi:hypothetical protein